MPDVVCDISNLHKALDLLHIPPVVAGKKILHDSQFGAIGHTYLGCRFYAHRNFPMLVRKSRHYFVSKLNGRTKGHQQHTGETYRCGPTNA